LNAGNAEQADSALSSLRLMEEIERAFLDKYLKDTRALLLDDPRDRPSGVEIEAISR
jgi:hypothetical protein